MSAVLNTILLYLISLSGFFLVRIFLYLRYDFSDLTTMETILSFLKGLQVDIITLNTFTGVFFLLLILPFKFATKRTYRRILSMLWFSVLAVMLILSAGDVIYYGYVGRHMTKEILTLVHDTGFLAGSAVTVYLPYTIVAIAFIILTGYIFWKVSSVTVTIPQKRWTKIILIFTTIVFLFFGARGKILRKPFGIADAFINGKLSSGNLAINGFYSFYRTSFSRKGGLKHRFMSDQRALKIVKNLIASERTIFCNQKFPLVRKYTVTSGSEKKTPNFIVILLESFSALYIDSFNEGAGGKLKVTPNFDYLANNGIKFTNFYANGIRSLDGITSILTGIIRPPGVDYLGSGLELSNLSYLPKLLKKKGYHSTMLQASWRRSLRVDSIARIAGFDEYYGAEDMNFPGPEIRHPLLGTWDRNMYDMIIKLLDHTKEPFFIFAFTAATHIPFISPGKKWEKYRHSEGQITGFLNTLYYADWAIGKFMKEAEKKKWFKNTIFFFVADHTFLLNNTPLKQYGIELHRRPLEFMRIPLIIYAPGRFYPEEVTSIHSQVDIFNTIIDLAGIKSPFASAGNSVFDQSHHFALNVNGYYYTMVTPDGFVSYDLKEILRRYGKFNLNYIKAYDQTIFHLIYLNKLYP